MTSKRIFVIEDDSHIRESLPEVLEIESSNGFSAVNGQKALELLQQSERADLILLISKLFSKYQQEARFTN